MVPERVLLTAVVPEALGEPLAHLDTVGVAEPPVGLREEEALGDHVPVAQGVGVDEGHTDAVPETVADTEGDPEIVAVRGGDAVTELEWEVEGVAPAVADVVDDLLAVEEPQSVPEGDGVAVVVWHAVVVGEMEVHAETVEEELPVGVFLLVGDTDTVAEGEADVEEHGVEDAVREGVLLVVEEGESVGEASEEADAVGVAEAHADRELEAVPVVLTVPQADRDTVVEPDAQNVGEGVPLEEKHAVIEYVGEGVEEALLHGEAVAEAQGEAEALSEAVGHCDAVVEAELHKVPDCVEDSEADTVRDAVWHADAEGDAEMEPERDEVAQVERDAVGQPDWDGDALTDLEPHPEAVPVEDSEGEGLPMVRDAEGVRLVVPEPHSVGEVEALGVALSLPLPAADAVDDWEREGEPLPHAVAEAEAHWVALPVPHLLPLALTEGLRVPLPQPVGVGLAEELREGVEHTEGVALCEGLSVPLPHALAEGHVEEEAVPVGLPVPVDVAEEVAVACRRRATPGEHAVGPSSSKRSTRGRIRITPPAAGGEPPRPPFTAPTGRGAAQPTRRGGEEPMV